MKAGNNLFIEITFAVAVLLIVVFMTNAGGAEEASTTESTTISVKMFEPVSSTRHGAVFIGDVPLLYFYEPTRNVIFQLTDGTIVKITPEDIKTLNDVDLRNLLTLINIPSNIWASHNDLCNVFINRLMPQQFIDRARGEGKL